MNLQELLNKLPLELIYKIQSYILKPQPKKLLYDLKHFQVSKKLGEKLYKERFNTELNPKEYLNWYVNDIGRYLNEDIATMYGYVEKYYQTFMRLYQINDKQTVLSYNLINLIKKEPEIELNITWGLMKPKEREEMIAKFFNADEIKNAHKSLSQSLSLNI
tara:strand:- start:789 stop:1271 length:483 start_codon:yes stop_codon:yes gene_type:complete